MGGLCNWTNILLITINWLPLTPLRQKLPNAVSNHAAEAPLLYGISKNTMLLPFGYNILF